MALNDYSGVKVSRTNPLVKRLLATAFPDYSGRKIRVRAWTGPRQLENFWSEGSRSYYVAVRAIDGHLANFGADNPFLATSHEPVDLPAGVILVERSIIAGTEAGITIWLSTAKQLPEAPPNVLAASGLLHA